MQRSHNRYLSLLFLVHADWQCLVRLTIKACLLFVLVFNIQASAGVPSDNKSLSLTGINLSVRVLLQGAYNGETGLMHDQLRQKSLVPVNQPYTAAPFNYQGVEQLTADLLQAGGPDAIVDWVLLELRGATDSEIIVARQAVALQRDGDLVNPENGTVALNFAQGVPGEYHVAVRHRNHLGVLTALALNLDKDITLIDFSTAATPVIGEQARVNAAPFVLLWAGDGNQDGRLIANGVSNDVNPLLGQVLLARDNSSLSSSYQLSGYLKDDFNLDGKVIYVGPGNDVNQLSVNILTHPDNVGFLNNFVVTGTGQF